MTTIKFNVFDDMLKESLISFFLFHFINEWTNKSYKINSLIS